MQVLNLTGTPATECERRAGVFDPMWGEATRLCEAARHSSDNPVRAVVACALAEASIHGASTESTGDVLLDTHDPLFSELVAALHAWGKAVYVSIFILKDVPTYAKTGAATMPVRQFVKLERVTPCK